MLRRTKSGPGVKAALTMGTTTSAGHIAVLGNFMMLFDFELLPKLSYTQKVVTQEDVDVDVDVDVGHCSRCKHPFNMLNLC